MSAVPECHHERASAPPFAVIARWTWYIFERIICIKTLAQAALYGQSLHGGLHSGMDQMITGPACSYISTTTADGMGIW